MAGQSTNTLPESPSLTHVLGEAEAEAGTARQAIPDLAAQLAARPEFESLNDDLTARVASAEDEIDTLHASTQYAAILKATWADLSALSGVGDGQRAEVDAGDTGTHGAASETGYDGSAVDNSGSYSWDAAWSRWVRIGKTTSSGMQDQIENKADANATDTVGHSSGTISEQASLSAMTFALATPVARSGNVTTLWADCNVTGTLSIRIFDPSGNTFTQSGSDVDVTLTAGGVDTITLDTPIAVTAGQYIGGYSSAYGVLTFESGSSDYPVYSASGDQTSFSDATASLNVQIGFDVTVEVVTPAAIEAIDARLDDLEVTPLTSQFTLGNLRSLVVGDARDDAWRIVADPAPVTGTITSVEWYRSGGTITVGIWERSGVTLTKDREVDVTDLETGVIEKDISLAIERGQFVGYRGDALGSLRASTDANDVATPLYRALVTGDLTTLDAQEPGISEQIQARVTITAPASDVQVVTPSNSSRIIVFGDSYTQSDYTLPGKAWLSLVSERTRFSLGKPRNKRPQDGRQNVEDRTDYLRRHLANWSRRSHLPHVLHRRE